MLGHAARLSLPARLAVTASALAFVTRLGNALLAKPPEQDAKGQRLRLPAPKRKVRLSKPLLPASSFPSKIC
jgi:hypothetical protein